MRLCGEDFTQSFRYASSMNGQVNPGKEMQLIQRMAALGVHESDIEETFVRSGGHGGQNVNKSATCVMLLHRLTGLQVKCQTTRQQGLNWFLARRLLLDKIEARQKGYIAGQRAETEKIRRQKRPRSRGAKQRMLANKSRRADKKLPADLGAPLFSTHRKDDRRNRSPQVAGLPESRAKSSKSRLQKYFQIFVKIL
jgi:protein subunit release factor B